MDLEDSGSWDNGFWNTHLGPLPQSSRDLPNTIHDKHVGLGAASASASYKTKLRRRTPNAVARVAAKHYASVANTSYICHDLGISCTDRVTACERCSPRVLNRVLLQRRLHQDIRARGVGDIIRGQRCRSRCCSSRGAGPNSHRGPWLSDEQDGLDLARSAVGLPGDGSRLVRRPSLEREEAFCDASTYKPRKAVATSMSEDAQIAELYRMGLLYDDDQTPGGDFDLNSIKHEEPIYTIRPARRSRKHQTKPRSYSHHEPLHLNLSFTDLGSDRMIAQVLSNSGESSSDDGSLPDGNAGSGGGNAWAPLRIVYEVDGSQPSFDVDTSQPPDLVSDLLSDYDCFSDSELDDLPAEREVRDGAATSAADAWVVLGDDS